MSRKLSLPLSLWDERKKPTVDAVRKRLGGRAATEPGVGEAVYLRSEQGFDRVGVVLFVHADELHVWIDGGVVRRAARASTRAVDGAVSADLLAVAADARAFAALREGEQVRFPIDEGVGVGALVEKCRFGGLVERDDGTVIGVGFRKLRPADPRESN